jgi:hypothetical protein
MLGSARLAIEASQPARRSREERVLRAEIGAITQCPHREKETMQGPADAIDQTPAGSATTAPAGEADRSAVRRGLPWLVSVSLHVCLGLLMAFEAMVVIRNQLPDQVTAPDAVLSEALSGTMSKNPDDGPTGLRQRQPTEQPAKSVERRYYQRQTELPADVDRTNEKVELLGVGGLPGGSPIKLGLDAVGDSVGPRSRFFGTGGNAYHIVYVVDRSGSMFVTFADVRREVLTSIGRLRPPQDYHVILFGDDKALENPPRRLVAATDENKRQTAQFLSGVVGQGSTTALPALKRAFAVLSNTGKLPGRLIYLLSDGNFAGVSGGSTYQSGGRLLQGDDAVVQWLRDNNKNRQVHVNTYLYGFDDPREAEVLKKIAAENGGKYEHIGFEE